MTKLLIPTRSDRLQSYPDIARALDHHLKQHTLTVTKFHLRLERSRDDLNLGKVPTRDALTRLLSGKPTFRSTAEPVARYLREHATDIVLSDAPQCAAHELNLAAFIGVSDRKMRRVGPALAGRYVAYALAESVPGLLRIGAITITFDPRTLVLSIVERQARPEIRHDGKVIFAKREPTWEGVIAPRKERPMAVLRMTQVGATDLDLKTMVFEAMHLEAGSNRIGEIEIHSYNAYEETKHNRLERYWVVRDDHGDDVCTVAPLYTFPMSLIDKVRWPKDPLLTSPAPQCACHANGASVSPDNREQHALGRKLIRRVIRLKQSAQPAD